jgi:hypothetical protein
MLTAACVDETVTPLAGGGGAGGGARGRPRRAGPGAPAASRPPHPSSAKSSAGPSSRGAKAPTAPGAGETAAAFELPLLDGSTYRFAESFLGLRVLRVHPRHLGRLRHGRHEPVGAGPRRARRQFARQRPLLLRLACSGRGRGDRERLRDGGTRRGPAREPARRRRRALGPAAPRGRDPRPRPRRLGERRAGWGTDALASSSTRARRSAGSASSPTSAATARSCSNKATGRGGPTSRTPPTMRRTSTRRRRSTRGSSRRRRP